MAISFCFDYFDNAPRWKKLLLWSRRKISMFNPIKTPADLFLVLFEALLKTPSKTSKRVIYFLSLYLPL